MNVEEYKSIRDEMLQRFRWTIELSFFSFASTGTLLSWLSTKSSSEQLNPFFFICIGLGIVGFIYYSYLNVLRGIYNQGGYLTVFHEGSDQDFKWHTLSRFRNELIKEKSDWGSDGRRGAIFLILLTIANIVGPLWFLKANFLICDWFGLLTMAMAVVLVVCMGLVIYKLFNTKKFMKENLKKWWQVKENLQKDQNLLENIIKSSLGT